MLKLGCVVLVGAVPKVSDLLLPSSPFHRGFSGSLVGLDVVVDSVEVVGALNSGVEGT